MLIGLFDDRYDIWFNQGGKIKLLTNEIGYGLIIVVKINSILTKSREHRAKS